MSPKSEVQSPKSEIESKSANRETRVLLWDIDGTMLIAPRSGNYKEYFAKSLSRVYGSHGTIWEMGSVSGMTDLQIAFEALKPANVTLETIYERKDDFHKAFTEEMSKVCDANHFRILDGVREILQATRENPLFVNALLTGNLENAAKHKLKLVGLDEFFDFELGAFGDSSHQRQDLPQIAADKISAKFDYNFEPSQFTVLGDTPNDIACARYFGAKAVAVATGRSHPPETLSPHNPDFLFENLSDTAKVIEVLSKL